MADVFSKEKRSEIMSQIRSKNTLMERKVFRFLRKNKVYFRVHYTGAIGKPDIARPRDRKAIFLDGDFWHGRDYKIRSQRLPLYWNTKIAANMKRDKKYTCLLKEQGWNVLRVWEGDLEKEEEASLKKIYTFLFT